MIPYLSYWSAGYRGAPSDYLIDLHKVSAFLCKKNYGQVHLVTDKVGAETLGRIREFDSVEISDKMSEIPVEYGSTWSLGKMIAYEHIANKNQPFIHVDYDVFLFKRLPPRIESAPVLAQNIEWGAYSFYGVQKYKKAVKEESIYTKDRYLDFAYNLGVFGGNDTDFIKEYAKTSVEMILKEEDKAFWTREFIPGVDAMWENATTAEQWYLACCEHAFGGKKVACLFDRVDQFNCPLEEDAKNLGYTHIWGLKNSPSVKRSVANFIVNNGLDYKI